jgi:adenosine deaminase
MRFWYDRPIYARQLLLTLAQRLTSSMPTHPLPAMLNNGVPVALSSDDPAMFGSLGLAYDFYQVSLFDFKKY